MNIDRVYSLHQIFRARRRPVSTAELMEKLGCSRSTLHRTIEYLRDRLCAPIDNVSGSGYFYDQSAETYELPGIWFRPDELEALLVMDHLLHKVQPGLLNERISPLRGRLKEILAAGVPKRREFPMQRVRILPIHARKLTTGQLIPVSSALVERLQLSCEYTARSKAGVKQRRVSPQRIVYYRDQWYLDCWDEDKRALRTFSVDRMQKIKVLDQPAHELAEEELNALLTSGYGIFSGRAQHRARLRFSAERAKWVADEQWHPDQESRYLEDGRYELTIPYSDPTELVGDILRHGAEVEVVAPSALAKQVRDQLKRALAQYQ